MPEETPGRMLVLLRTPPLSNLVQRLNEKYEIDERKRLLINDEDVILALCELYDLDEREYKDFLERLQSETGIGKIIRDSLNRKIVKIVNETRIKKVKDEAEKIIPGISALDLNRDKNGIIESWENIERILDQLLKGLYGIDLYFSAELYFLKRPHWLKEGESTSEAPGPLGWIRMTDNDITQLMILLSNKYILPKIKGKTIVEDILVDLARRKYIVDYYQEIMNVLPKWDGVSRLDTWLFDWLKAEYTNDAQKNLISAMGRKFLIGMLARCYKPGCSMRTILILEGEQRIGKSRFIKELFSPFSAEHNGRRMDLTDSDTFSFLLGRVGVEIAEFGRLMKGNDASIIKDYLSRTEDRFRSKYGRKHENHPRRIVFCGSLNPDEGEGYLNDSTGESRFYPIKCGHKFNNGEEIDVNGFSLIKNLLLAEAKLAFENGETWWLGQKESLIHADYVADREAESPATEVLHQYIQENKNDIMEYGLRTVDFKMSVQNNFSNSQLSKALKECGLVSYKPYIGKIQIRLWIFSDTKETVEKNIKFLEETKGTGKIVPFKKPSSEKGDKDG